VTAAEHCIELCACRYARLPATHEHRQELGSSPLHSRDHLLERCAINGPDTRSRQPPASSISIVPRSSVIGEERAATGDGAGSVTVTNAEASLPALFLPNPAARRQRNTRLGATPCLRATDDIEAVFVSSTICLRSASLHRRRVSTTTA